MLPGPQYGFSHLDQNLLILPNFKSHILKTELKNKHSEKRMVKIGQFSKKVLKYEVCERSKMTRFRTPSGDNFTRKIDLGQVTPKKSIVR